MCDDKEATVARFDLPTDPVDGFTVVWWILDTNGWLMTPVTKVTATYHVDTKWQRGMVVPARLDLRDQWSVSYGAHPMYRSCGWPSINEMAKHGFVSERDAKLMWLRHKRLTVSKLEAELRTATADADSLAMELGVG